MTRNIRRIFDAIFDTIDDAMHEDKQVITPKLVRTTYTHDNSRIRTTVFIPKEIRPYCDKIADEIQVAVDGIVKAHLEAKPEANTVPVVNTEFSNTVVSDTIPIANT